MLGVIDKYSPSNKAVRRAPFGPGVRYFSDELLARAWPPFLGGALRRRAALLALTVAAVAVDYATGPTIRFPSVFMLPMLLGAWYDGFLAGCAAGAAIVAARVVLETRIWPSVPWPASHTAINAASALAMVVLFSWYCALAGRLTREIGLLWGLLTVCMDCRRVRTDKQEWLGLEEYVMKRSEARFSHGICPDCKQRRSPEEP